MKKNSRLAMEYYMRASLYGDKQSIFEIGRCYYYGIGISKNSRLARIWLDRASELGIKDKNDKCRELASLFLIEF